MRFLLFCPSALGGFPRHSHSQAAELARRGIGVEMLSRPEMPVRPEPGSYRQNRCLLTVPGPGPVRKLLRTAAGVANYWILAWVILRRRPDVVLLEANTEYFAPLWAWPHLLIAALTRTRYLANFHDPVRDRRMGPRWWHRLTLYLAFRPLSGGLVHGAVPPGAQIPAWVRLRSVPHGLFGDMAASAPSFDLRASFGIAPGRFVLLSFGLIADRKNLDLLIDAVAATPDVDLVIAGQDVSAAQRPASTYRAHAERRGVADRVHFDIRFIPDGETAAYFEGADAVALTYNREFVSQSGVLQLAARWDKPVLASSGPGPLQASVENRLGLFVPPDDPAALARGLGQLVAGWRSDPAAFAAYRDQASWAANIDGLLALVSDLRGEPAR